VSQPKPRKYAKKPTTALDAGSEEESDDDQAVRLPFAIRDQELIKRAFAGADVVGDFEAEKKQTIEDEEEKVIDNTLPGWGSWTGDGLSKKEKAKNKGRFLTKSEGIKEKNRKDAKLERVIMNEKRVKKVRVTSYFGWEQS
jgi:U3 small nucleolar RNA-associated protein 14